MYKDIKGTQFTAVILAGISGLIIPGSFLVFAMNSVLQAAH